MASWLALVTADERSPLLVERDLVSAAGELDAERNDGLANPEEGEDGESQGRPVNERVAGLVRKDGPEGPGDGEARGKVTLGRGEGVGHSGGLEEEEGQEDKDLGPDAGMVGESVDTEGVEGREDDEDGGPAVVEGEGEVHEDLVRDARGLVILLDDVVDVSDRRGDEECEDEG